MLIFNPIIHRLVRGHRFMPRTCSYDKYGEYYDGCETCYNNSPVTFYGDRHRAGLCPKVQDGYTCYGKLEPVLECKYE